MEADLGPLAPGNQRVLVQILDRRVDPVEELVVDLVDIPVAEPGPPDILLHDGRFRVTVSWRDFQGHSGTGRAAPGTTRDSGLFTFLTARDYGSVASTTVLPIGSRVGNALIAYVQYMEKMIWPADLAFFYPHPLGALPAWKIAGSLL